jgi:hypothetical protein
MSGGIVLEAMRNVWAMRFSEFARAAARAPRHAHAASRP